jgi:methionine sulfoxide reductase heme-binding subunit
MTHADLTAAFWALGRGTGVVALVLFTLSLVLGIVARSGRPLPGLGRFGISDLHRTAALTGTGLVAAHVGSLLLDPYAQLKVVDLVFPFLADYRPLWLGLGTVALDLIGVITVVSLLRRRVGPKVFRTVHWATYALWPTALLHALGSGTDAASPWFRAVAVVCIFAVVTAVGWRLAPSYDGRGWVRRPRRVA